MADRILLYDEDWRVGEIILSGFSPREGRRGEQWYVGGSEVFVNSNHFAADGGQLSAGQGRKKHQ